MIFLGIIGLVFDGIVFGAGFALTTAVSFQADAIIAMIVLDLLLRVILLIGFSIGSFCFGLTAIIYGLIKSVLLENVAVMMLGYLSVYKTISTLNLAGMGSEGYTVLAVGFTGILICSFLPFRFILGALWFGVQKVLRILILDYLTFEFSLGSL